MTNIKNLFELIAIKNPIHAKYLNKISLTNEDEIEFENLISYYLQSNISLQE